MNASLTELSLIFALAESSLGTEGAGGWRVGKEGRALQGGLGESGGRSELRRTTRLQEACAGSLALLSCRKESHR